jgi:hypothetical protein
MFAIRSAGTLLRNESFRDLKSVVGLHHRLHPLLRCIPKRTRHQHAIALRRPAPHPPRNLTAPAQTARVLDHHRRIRRPPHSITVVDTRMSTSSLNHPSTSFSSVRSFHTAATRNREFHLRQVLVISAPLSRKRSQLLRSPDTTRPAAPPAAAVAQFTCFRRTPRARIVSTGMRPGGIIDHRRVRSP